ncbi:MAG: acyl-homoserine-lactone synthase [Gammaproteobacteria bacterium]
MNVVSGRQSELPDGLYEQVANYRHKVFVEQLGWELDTSGNTEQDQFDRADTVYVVSRDDGKNVSGCARLLPTTQPYLLGDVFPQLLDGMSPPSTVDVWELSRFAAVDFTEKPSAAKKQFTPSQGIKLLREAIAIARKQGAKRMITVSPVGVERLLKRAGIRAHRAGPTMHINGHSIFACWIDTQCQ